MVGAAALAWFGFLAGMCVEGLTNNRWRGLPMWLGAAAGAILGGYVGRNLGQQHLDFSIPALLATSLVTKILLVISLMCWLMLTVGTCMEMVRIKHQKLDQGISLITPIEWVLIPLSSILFAYDKGWKYGVSLFLLGICFHLLYMLCVCCTAIVLGRFK